MIDDNIKRSELLSYLKEYKDHIEKRPMMYGANFDSIESIWHTISTVESHVKNKDSDADAEKFRNAYRSVSEKYKCGCLHLSSDLSQKTLFNSSSCRELIKRLREVDEILDKNDVF